MEASRAAPRRGSSNLRMSCRFPSVAKSVNRASGAQVRCKRGESAEDPWRSVFHCHSDARTASVDHFGNKCATALFECSTHHGRTHIIRQPALCRFAGEAGSPCTDTVTSATCVTLAILVQTGLKTCFLTGACDTKTDIVVLVRRGVVVPVRRRQVVGAIVPVATADPASRRNHAPASPFLRQRFNTA